MLGDDLLYSKDISRTSEQGGLLDSAWCSGVLPTRAIQLGHGPCKKVNVQCPIYTSHPGTGNPWAIWVGGSNFQTRYISPGAVATFECDRLDYLWVRRETDYSGAMEPDITTALVVGFDFNYDPPFAQYESQGGQNRRLLQRLLEKLGLKK